jgi:hypothetical protein
MSSYLILYSIRICLHLTKTRYKRWKEVKDNKDGKGEITEGENGKGVYYIFKRKEKTYLKKGKRDRNCNYNLGRSEILISLSGKAKEWDVNGNS